MAIANFLGALPVGTGLPISHGASYNQLIYTSPLLGYFTFKGTGLDTGAGHLLSGFLKNRRGASSWM